MKREIPKNKHGGGGEFIVERKRVENFPASHFSVEKKEKKKRNSSEKKKKVKKD